MSLASYRAAPPRVILIGPSFSKSIRLCIGPLDYNRTLFGVESCHLGLKPRNRRGFRRSENAGCSCCNGSVVPFCVFVLHPAFLTRNLRNLQLRGGSQMPGGTRQVRFMDQQTQQSEQSALDIACSNSVAWAM